jgi:ABC-type sulfate/molybdate transport systems ATPase subunit
VIDALRLDDLSVAAPGGPVRVSVEVEPGQLGAVVLPPKPARAVARVVAGLVGPRSGRVFVGPRDVTALPPVRRQVGYVPVGGGLLPHLTVRRNIEYGLRRRERVHDVAEDWVRELTDGLELRATLDLRPHQLSDAQRLRAALARAAACLPEAMVLDLPAAAGGAEHLSDLIPKMSPAGAPGVAVLVCSADLAVLGQVEVRAVTR